jgi:hypothetical protein
MAASSIWAAMTPELGEAPRDGNTMNSEHYRHLAEEEAALAKTAVSNTSRAQHYAMATYYNRLADAKERLVTVAEAMIRNASTGT